MDNPTRTANFRAQTDARRRELLDQLARIFPPGARFTWEIGCGHGHFLTAYAQAHPTELCVGIDIAGDRIARAVRKRDRAKLANLHFLQAEARLFLDTLPIDAAFLRLFVLFPDPWPKLRHHKHRIIQSDFLTAAARRAGEAARLYFRTDYVPYFSATETLLKSHLNWSLTEEAWPFEHQTVFQSRAPNYGSLVAQTRRPQP